MDSSEPHNWSMTELRFKPSHTDANLISELQHYMTYKTLMVADRYLAIRRHYFPLLYLLGDNSGFPFRFIIFGMEGPYTSTSNKPTALDCKKTKHTIRLFLMFTVQKKSLYSNKPIKKKTKYSKIINNRQQKRKMARVLFKLVLYFNNQLVQVSCIVLKNLSPYLSKHDFENK